MNLQHKIAKISALAMILALPLLLSGCGSKPAPVPAQNTNTPIDQTSGNNGGLTPADQASGTEPLDNAPQNVKEIKNDADINNILNNLNSDDKSNNIKSVDENDINQF